MKSLSLHDQMNEMEQIVRGFLRRPFSIEPAAPEIRLDLSEDDDAYTIHAEIPGATKSDIKIDLDENYVSISAQKQNRTEHKNGSRWICSERSFGVITRALSLAHEIDPPRARASYADGVLELTLPKKARSTLHSVEIG